jgi:7-cyano-7-deazaguanine synthase in queuosine biosynthesis
MAEEHEIDRIWIGADFSDYLNKFPDCTQEYIGQMNDVLNVGLSRPITLEAPLLGLTKKMVISLLDAMGVPVTEYFSGYGLGEEE